MPRSVVASIKSALRLVPGLRPLHHAYHRHRLTRQRGVLAKKICLLHEGTPDAEIQEVLRALRRGALRMIPYSFADEYRESSVEVGFDDGLPFAKLGAHRVYFPREYGPAAVRLAVTEALIEQDERSPHCYLHERISLSSSDTAVLIGASDGIFALRILPRVQSLVVFEPDPRWSEPLARTLSPWRDRIHIVHAFVGQRAGRDTVSLDSYFRGRADTPAFIQADVEGAELDVVRGAREIIQQAPRISLSICAYHRQDHLDVLSEELRSLGCSVAPSKGYVIAHGELLRPPYLRRGVLYAVKSNTRG